MSHWQNRAACAGHPDPDLFTNGHRAHEAAQVCAVCPVVEPCRQAGIGTSIGTWGGVFHKTKAAPSLTAAYLEQHGTPAGYNRHLDRGERPCDRCTTAHLFDWHAREQVSPQQRKPAGKFPTVKQPAEVRR